MKPKAQDTVTVSVRLTHAQYAALKEAAEAEYRTPTAFIRMLIEIDLKASAIRTKA